MALSDLDKYSKLGVSVSSPEDKDLGLGTDFEVSVGNRAVVQASCNLAEFWAMFLTSLGFRRHAGN
jgi:hypothetical protein